MQFAKRILTVCFVATLAISTGGLMASATAQNLLVNGDFETGDLTGWEVAGGNASAGVTVETPDNGPAFPGTNNAYLNNMGEAVGLTLKQVTAPGTAAPGLINYSFDLKLDQADAGGVLFVEIFAEAEGVGIIGGSGLMGPFWPWGEWETFGGGFIAPENTSFLTIQIMANTGATQGTNCLAHVDNVVLDLNGIVADETTSLDSIKALYR